MRLCFRGLYTETVTLPNMTISLSDNSRRGRHDKETKICVITVMIVVAVVVVAAAAAAARA